jgi:histone acetyltransferase 1
MAEKVADPTKLFVEFLTDNPRYSSAAMSISFQIAGDTTASFRPEYTHQCVGETEAFVGYRPPKEVLDAARVELQGSHGQKVNNNKDDDSVQQLLHKSHQGHQSALAELAIQVSLAPSCESCHINIDVTKLSSSSPSKAEESAAKRVKLGDENTSIQVMPKSQIVDSLRKALPPMEDMETSDNVGMKEKFLSAPMGQVLDEYTLQGSDDTSSSFVISLADGRDSEVAEYHHKVQPLALFYIENADNVNVANTDNGYWKVLYVFEKKHNNDDNNVKQYSFVGYFTLFHFNALFHKPKPGIIIRICQALILPPYQGQGHGSRLMQAAYKLAHQTREQNGVATPQDIVQVNVEDPAPAFVALRNKSDYHLVQQNGQELGWPGWKEESCQLDASFFTSLTDAQALDLSAKLKITPQQIHIVNDLIKLKALHDSAENPDEKEQDLERLFRLMVKKRLNKEHREELGGLGSKEEQKAMLAELFEARLKGYEGILKSKKTRG